MLAKTLVERTTQKRQNTLAHVLTAKALVFLTAYAPTVDFMQEETLSKKQKANLPHIGLDLMGSDSDPGFILDSLLPALEEYKQSAHFVLFGEESLQGRFTPSSFASFAICSDAITMQEDPLKAVREKKKSSLNLGIEGIKLGELQAFISMGNTGALLASARAKLGTISHITRPALLTLLPTQGKSMVVLDVGANLECSSERLLEFAAMGCLYQRMRGMSTPSLGLLNIGTEAIKGPLELQKTHSALSLLAQKNKNFVFLGNIEGQDAFNGHIDVLVTAGFTGNIFLKTTEGAAKFFMNELSTQPCNLNAIKKKLDYREYPGAILCGVDGLIIKCHSSAKPIALQSSISCALHLIKQNFLHHMKSTISSFFE
jgi:phosphate acyltransferase